jgi:hypothetical protein
MIKKKTSFIYDILIILLISIFVYLAYIIVVPSNYSQINQIYEEYSVSNDLLIPENRTEYISALQSVNNYSASLIVDFILLDIETEKLERNIKSNILYDCVPSDLYRLFESYLIKKNALLDSFKESNNITNQKLYWSQYINNLKQNNIQQIYENVKNLERC